MKTIIEENKEIEVISCPDVLVIGGGPAGIGAAIAAARMGVNTMLIERYGFVGGNLTVAMVNPIFTFHDINGRQIINGIAQELIEKLQNIGGSLGHVTDLTFDNASMTPFDPELCKYVLLQMLEEAGVHLLLHSLFVDTIVENNVIKYVIIENKSGRQAICPKYVIDCSADADVVYHTGIKCLESDENDGALQPASLYFRIGGTDTLKLKEKKKKNRLLLKDSPTNKEIDSQKAIAFLGLNNLVENAISSGLLDNEVAPRILMYELPNGQFSVNTTRLQNVNGTDVKDLTRAEINLRKQVIQVFNFIRNNISGFENSYIIDSGIQVGIRETRRIIGEYVLTEDDVLKGKSFYDGIACGTFAIDIHPPHGKKQIFTGSGRAVYEIPYRCLLPKGLENVLVAGRCISVNHIALGSIRVMATCIAIGQGAGTAAAMSSINNNGKLRDINIDELRAKLISVNQYLLNDSEKEIVDEGLKLNRVKSDGANAGHYNPFLLSDN